MNEETHQKLRAPFPADVIGKLPRVWCPKCRDAIKSRRPSCEDHRRAKCSVCNNNMTDAHLHIDYVGHAAITDRLLQVDHEWTWEPIAFDEAGLPALDRSGGLWIRLTVAGVTRLGYGDAEGKTGPSAVKEAIGDALRNGAMRFGVGLDLWHKDGQLVQDEEPAAPPQQRRPEQQAESTPDQARARLRSVCAENGWDLTRVAAVFYAQYQENLREATDVHRVNAFVKNLFAMSDADLKAPATNGAPA